MSWGTKRRNAILSLFFFGLLILIGTYLFIFLNKEPTCFDGKKNGDEAGIDCGGSCALKCEGEIIDVVIHWNRYFEIVPGVYNALAYIENLNADSGVLNAKYLFTLYDEKNFVLDRRYGQIKIRPKEIIPIFEPGLDTGKLIPARSTFEFTEKLIWQKTEPNDRYLQINNQRFFEVDGLPRISADITNTSIFRSKDIKIVVIIYDEQGNAITTSSTIVDTLEKDQTRQIIYTWPQQFSRPMSRFEIIPLYD
ncbi:MAG TPA: hypothetical protein PJ997_02490 [Candidatus Paceibacterota bacterium]|nr:hypothetical protein [Candidatus Paceibacterota bacterium]HMP19179.1 hypothetical protein [Candidatus Paceibacterota bacterium]HMP85290.1 hypothetical protein [Candidatus Paceibacterota bacterium]